MADKVEELEQCEVVRIHSESIQKAKERMPYEDHLFNLMDFFHIFVGSTGVKIVCALLSTELCVCDIAELLEISQSATSHQLRMFKQARLVKSRRTGKVIYYSLDDEYIEGILSLGLSHIEEEQSHKQKGGNESMAAKEFVMEDLGCAHYAAEIEHGVGKLDGISKASFDFVSKTLQVELLDENRFPELTGRMQGIAQSHEPDIRLTERRATQAGERVLYLGRLDYADCATKIEREIQKLDGVRGAQVSFIAQRMVLKASNRRKLPVLTREAVRIVDEIEPDITVSLREEETGEDEGESRKRISRILLAVGVVLSAATMTIPMAELPSFLLFLAAYLLIDGEILLIALRNIRCGQIFDENLLMSIATIGASAVGEFPEGVVVMLFYRVGELFQDMAVNRLRSSIKALMNIRPDFANLKLGGEVHRVSPEEVGIGDLILVKTNEEIPLDSVVVQDISSLDTSALTGESLPRDIQPGSEALSGSINQSDLLTIQVQKKFGDSTASRTLELVQNASGEKAPTENFVTRFARYRIPAVVFTILALAVILPLMIPGAEFHSWIYRALAFLVVSCPCALVISILLSFFGGIDTTSRQRTLIKDSNYLEALNGPDTIIFDKTDTLTKDSFTITEILSKKMEKAELLRYTTLTESISTHPIAQSIVRAYGQPVDEGQVVGHTEIAKHGVRAVIGGKTVLAGNSRLMESENIRFEPVSAPGSLVYLAVDDEYAGCLVISDEIKPDSRRAVEALRQAEVHTAAMLTDDSRTVAESVAETIGVDTVYSKLLPDQKVERVGLLDSQKSPSGKPTFVGDGINDTPVLARTDISIAVGGIGSNATIETADVVLMTDELSKLPAAVRVVKGARRVTWQNIWFALDIRAVILILATAETAAVWAAIFDDVGVALIVVLNAMRALKTK